MAAPKVDRSGGGFLHGPRRLEDWGCQEGQCQPDRSDSPRLRILLGLGLGFLLNAEGTDKWNDLYQALGTDFGPAGSCCDSVLHGAG